MIDYIFLYEITYNILKNIKMYCLLATSIYKLSAKLKSINQLNIGKRLDYSVRSLIYKNWKSLIHDSTIMKDILAISIINKKFAIPIYQVLHYNEKTYVNCIQKYWFIVSNLTKKNPYLKTYINLSLNISWIFSIAKYMPSTHSVVQLLPKLSNDMNYRIRRKKFSTRKLRTWICGYMSLNFWKGTSILLKIKSLRRRQRRKKKAYQKQLWYIEILKKVIWNKRMWEHSHINGMLVLYINKLLIDQEYDMKILNSIMLRSVFYEQLETGKQISNKYIYTNIINVYDLYNTMLYELKQYSSLVHYKKINLYNNEIRFLKWYLAFNGNKNYLKAKYDAYEIFTFTKSNHEYFFLKQFILKKWMHLRNKDVVEFNTAQQLVYWFLNEKKKMNSLRTIICNLFFECFKVMHSWYTNNLNPTDNSNSITQPYSNIMYEYYLYQSNKSSIFENYFRGYIGHIIKQIKEFHRKSKKKKKHFSVIGILEDIKNSNVEENFRNLEKFYLKKSKPVDLVEMSATQKIKDVYDSRLSINSSLLDVLQFNYVKHYANDYRWAIYFTYHDYHIKTFINFITKKGNKSLAYKIFYNVISTLKNVCAIPPLVLIKKLFSYNHTFIWTKNIALKKSNKSKVLLYNWKKRTNSFYRIFFKEVADSYLEDYISIHEKIAYLLLKHSEDEEFNRYNSSTIETGEKFIQQNRFKNQQRKKKKNNVIYRYNLKIRKQDQLLNYKKNY